MSHEWCEPDEDEDREALQPEALAYRYSASFKVLSKIKEMIMKHKSVVTILFLSAFLSFAVDGFAQEDLRDKNKLNENDVKSFVYQWFSWLDHQVGEFHFMSHLSSTGFEIRLPGITILDYAGFKRWYDCLRENIKRNSHELTDIKVSGDYEKGFDVQMTVRWRAETFDGDSCDNTYHHLWKIRPTYNELRFVITRYSVTQIR